MQRDIVVIASTTLVAALLHVATPAGSHSWHWLHLVAEKLYLVPILLAAARLGLPAALATALVVTGFFTLHVLRQWAGLPMVQAEQWAALVNFWLVAAVAGTLFERVHRSVAELGAAHEETLTALAGSLELREPYTAGHSRRVRDYSLALAGEMGLTGAAFRTGLARGALLHDVGKIGIPDRVLLKQGPLDTEEWQEMRKHPDLGADLIGDIPFLSKTRALVRAHQERYDGSGYPRGLSGRAIPMEARIFAVADAFDALTTDRPYRQAASWAEAARRIAELRGSQFDPEVVDAFQRIPFGEWSRVASANGVRLGDGRLSRAAESTGSTEHQMNSRPDAPSAGREEDR